MPVSKQSRKLSISAYKKWLVQTIQNYKDHLNLQGWDFRLTTEKEEKDKQGRITVYSVNVDPRYEKVYMTVYPVSYKMWCEDKEDAAYNVLHEMCHIFTEEMADFIRPCVSDADTSQFTDIWENATQRMSVALRKNLPRKLWDH